MRNEILFLCLGIVAASGCDEGVLRGDGPRLKGDQPASLEGHLLLEARPGKDSDGPAVKDRSGPPAKDVLAPPIKDKSGLPKDLSGPTTDGTPGLKVTWGAGCWYSGTGCTGKCQAMPFSLVAPKPIPLNGTLYFNTTCDPKDGTDNLNDTGGTTPNGSWLFWFIHFPNMPNTSAIWWLDTAKTGCIDYSTAPDC